MKSKYISLIAALIISLSLTLTPSIVRAEKYVYKINPYAQGFVQQYVPKSYNLRLNNFQMRYEWAPKHAQLTYDYSIDQWVYIPGIVARTR